MGNANLPYRRREVLRRGGHHILRGLFEAPRIPRSELQELASLAQDASEPPFGLGDAEA